MKALKLYILVLLVAGCISCNKKKYPESAVENTSVFYFKGVVNGQPVSLGAGPDNYYMYASYSHDSNNVYNFIGNLTKSNCNNCAYSLKIQINDFKITPAGSGAVKIDSSLMARQYPLATGDGYSVDFLSFYNKNAASYQWDFGDGQTSNDANPTHIFAKKGLYDVCLSIKGANACIGSICNTQKIGLGSSCTTTVQGFAVNNKSVSFSASVDGKAPFNYYWDFGDGRTSSAPSPLHAYALAGSYPVRLTLTDANNDVAVFNYNTVTQSDVSSCAANYRVSNILAVKLPDLSAATISWTDANGTVYKSDNALQPASSAFNILSVEDYDKNELGQKTKKVHMKFNCTLYNGSNAISVDGAEAVICVAYP